MPGIVDYPSFVVAVLVFLMLPGPGTLALLTASTRDGLRGGYAALLGLMLGDGVLMIAAVIGVATLLAAHPMLFKALQHLGLAYLVWVGLQLLRARASATEAAQSTVAAAHFRHGLLITAINPKAIVFYLAFFPLFIDPARYQGGATLAAMVATVSVLTLLYGSALVLGGHCAARRLRTSRRAGRWLSRAAGVTLIGFGVRLAMD